MPDTFDTLRPDHRLPPRHRGIDPRKAALPLPEPDHPDRNPSMAYDARRHKVHCFACGADYDLFDLLTIDRSYSSPADALGRQRTVRARRCDRFPPFSAAETPRITNRGKNRPAAHTEGGGPHCAPSFQADPFLPRLLRLLRKPGRNPYFSPRLSAKTP